MLLLSVALYGAAMQIDTSFTGGGRRIGPDFWPKAVILFMGALSLYEVVKRAVFGVDSAARGLTEDLTANPAGDPTTETAGEASTIQYPRLLLAGSALILGYVAVVDLLGFFITTLIFLFAFARVGGFRRHAWNAAIAVAGSLLMVFLFMRVAYISLPLGEGPFRSVSLALMTLMGVR